MNVLKSAAGEGFQIQLCSMSVDESRWEVMDAQELRDADVPEELIASVCGKKCLAERFQDNVIAIIDDEHNSSYINEVCQNNADAKLFKPTEVNQLKLYLENITREQHSGVRIL